MIVVYYFKRGYENMSERPQTTCCIKHGMANNNGFAKYLL